MISRRTRWFTLGMKGWVGRLLNWMCHCRYKISWQSLRTWSRSFWCTVNLVRWLVLWLLLTSTAWIRGYALGSGTQRCLKAITNSGFQGTTRTVNVCLGERWNSFAGNVKPTASIKRRLIKGFSDILMDKKLGTLLRAASASKMTGNVISGFTAKSREGLVLPSRRRSKTTCRMFWSRRISA
jgi:hypothetical protein